MSTVQDDLYIPNLNVVQKLCYDHANYNLNNSYNEKSGEWSVRAMTPRMI